MVRARWVWLAVAVLALALAGTPAVRQVVADRGVGPANPNPLPPENGATLAAAQRLNAGWADGAAAELLTGAEADRLFDQAVRRSPGDETLWIRRAMTSFGRPLGFIQTAAASPRDRSLVRPRDAARCERVTREAVAAAPDNAWSHLLRALALSQSGDADGAARELHAAAAAPHMDDGIAAQAPRLRRLLRAMGAGPSMMGTIPSLEWDLPATAQCRELARQVARRSLAEVAQGRPREACLIQLDLARVAGHWRDTGSSLVSSLVGQAIQAIAFNGGADHERPPAGLKDQALRTWLLEQNTARMVDRLHRAGLDAAVPWVRAEAARSAAIHRSIAASVSYDRALRDLEADAARMGTWWLWALGCAFLGAAWLAIAGWSSGRCRLLGEEPIGWHWREALTVWAVALLPGMLGFVVGALMPVPDKFAELRVLVPVAFGVLWPAFMLPLVLRWLARWYTERQGLEQPSARRDAARRFRRRAWPVVGSASAGALAFLALCAVLPITRHAWAMADRDTLAGERAVIQAAVNAAPPVPYPLP